MSELYPVHGQKIFIGGVLNPTKVDFVAGDFASQSWIEIDGWETAGARGDVAALISMPLISRKRDLKAKGSANAGSMVNNFANFPEDEGQLVLIAAADPSVKDSYAFRIDGNDAQGAGQPSKRYFSALVMSAQEQGGTANVGQVLSSTLEINSNIVRVART